MDISGYVNEKNLAAPRFHLFLHSQKRDDSVAQLVEQYTFNVWVLGSSPNGITGKKLHLYAVFFAFRRREVYFSI